jgi:hypothetical protein
MSGVSLGTIGTGGFTSLSMYLAAGILGVIASAMIAVNLQGD